MKLDISFPSLPFLCMLFLSRLHDPILEENLSKEPYGENLQGLKSPDEGSSNKGPHGQLLSLLSSFTILQQKLRCPTPTIQTKANLYSVGEL